MIFSRYPLLAIAALFFSSNATAAIDFVVRGVDGALKNNIEIYLNAIPETDRRISYRFQAQLEDEIGRSLKALGYYEPKLTITVLNRESDRDATIDVDVAPGEPIRIAELDYQITGEGNMDDDFHALRESAPQEGEVLDQGKYESFKSRIQSLAIKKGYFDGEFLVTRLEISPSRKEAFVRLHYATGKRYLYGDIVYENSQIKEARLDSMRSFKEGDPYLVTELGRFNQSLSNTGWFSSVLVQAQLEKAEDYRIPVTVSLSPEARNKFETGIGYSTDIGPRLKLNWRKPWFNTRGHSLSTSLSVSQPEQTFESTYTIPLEDVEREYYKIQFGLKNVDQRDTESLEMSAAVSRFWLHDEGWQHSIFIRWLYENYTQGDDEDVVNLIMPGINFTRARARGGLMPYWADKQTITFEAADENVLSDLSLFRIQGRSAWIRSLGKNHRGLVRLDGGALISDDFDKAPPSLRFFAGGDNSIRGYGYESVAPKNSDGQLIGGRHMLTGALEYQYRFADSWWWALFADAGDAWSSKADWKTAAGTGIRWESPVGPIRFDVAHGFDNEKDDFRIHLTLGPEL